MLQYYCMIDGFVFAYGSFSCYILLVMALCVMEIGNNSDECRGTLLCDKIFVHIGR